MSLELNIHTDIRRASTPSSELYTSPSVFEAMKDRIFAASWQFAALERDLKAPGQTWPFTLLPGFLDEPLLFTRDYDDQLHCLSNVCTHRGNLVCEQGGIEKQLRCRYHGRRFDLRGRMLGMPEFEGVVDFPSESDHLPQVAFERWGGMLFVSLKPSFSFAEAFAPMQQRLHWLDVGSFRFSPEHSKDYLIQANWALYCENYLEGFHIPYVHASLNAVLDYGNYTTETYRYSNLQLGYAKDGELSFQLPASSPDYGKRIGAYYYWIFPNLMFNFYPWGLSVNVVKPITVSQTRVTFLTFVADEQLFESGTVAMIDRVEREDEAVVENVQRGVRSRLYRKGRYSPRREQGTHHFHLLLAEFLSSKNEV
ncbi:MAG: aromatic ring-hydroxylating dioxygenase subunit alpha [Chitinophagales bacterium]|nr:aromatic ring-hydroxylating dioxygenase subunit alpha [Chitinophagales bacterium]MDW8427390.1 aromatic ring-hydroxylating dioxygenase subunit alpha [Chitinophagales bacterium]